MYTPQTKRFRVTAICTLCGYSQSTTLTTGEENIRADALRFLHDSARRHDEHGPSGNWCIAWEPSPMIGL